MTTNCQDLPLILIIHSHENSTYRDQILTQLGALAQQSEMEPWNDNMIDSSENWYQHFDQKLKECAVVILLVSAKFLSSKFVKQDEVPPLLEKRQREGMMIEPILVEHCHWMAVPWLRAIPDWRHDGNAIEALGKSGRNKEYSRIVQKIEAHLKNNGVAAAGANQSSNQQSSIIGNWNQLIQVEGIGHNIAVYGPSEKPAIVNQSIEEGPPMRHVEQPSKAKVDLSRLPTSGFEVVGRDDHLQLLDAAADDRRFNIISFVAWGGVGKSTLVNKWCEYLNSRNFVGFDFAYAWSFHSQGSSERITSSEAFIDEALCFFGADQNGNISQWAKGFKLAEIIGNKKVLLILDGIEPLQDEEGRIPDPALASLVHGLAENNKGLCIITTRQPVLDLVDFPDTTSERNLEQLSVAAGRAYLRVAGVLGSESELESASKEFNNNALALTLLATYLREIPGRKASYAAHIPKLTGVSVKDGLHPRRLMAAHAARLRGSLELEFLNVISLFDRPATAEAIEAVLSGPAIPNINDRLATANKLTRLECVLRLQSLGLLAPADSSGQGAIDAHPLVREHFAARLKKEYPEAWRSCHSRLSEYYFEAGQTSPEPKNISELAPLLLAIKHGCRAERRQEMLQKIYWPMVSKHYECFLMKKLGAPHTDLAVLSNFFISRWDKPIDEPKDANYSEYPNLRNLAGFRLLALGQLSKAIDIFKLEREKHTNDENWEWVYITLSNLTNLYLLKGDLPTAIATGRECVNISEQMCNDEKDHIIGMAKVRLSAGLHASGQFGEAFDILEKQVALKTAERKNTRPHIRLSTLKTYYYITMLFESNDLARARSAVAEISALHAGGEFGDLVDRSVDSLVLSCLSEMTGDLEGALRFVTDSVDAAQDAGNLSWIAPSLLARSRLHRKLGRLDACRQDLRHCMRIVRRGEMQLFKCDAYLEFARLALAENMRDDARNYLKSAAALVDTCEYHRRDREVAELKEKLIS